jgi:uncharacterized membrane protein HdeD (DUF308 family)
MSTTRESAFGSLQGIPFGDLRKNWGWLLALGVLSLVLGTLGLWMTFAMTLASILLFGVLLVVSGVSQLVQAISCKGWKSILWHVLIAMLYVAAGVVIVDDPILASVTLTMVLAGLLIAVGISRIVLAVQLRPSQGWYWPLISGAVSVLLAGMIIAHWPLSGFWVIGLFVAIELIFNGWSYVFVALAARKAGSQPAAA